MAKRKKKNILSTRKTSTRKASMLKPGGKSRYARKRAWCLANGKWGFEIQEPKPWK